MSFFSSFPDQQSSDTDDFLAMESAKHVGIAKPLREPSQRLVFFSFERAAVCFWVASKRFQSNVSI